MDNPSSEDWLSRDWVVFVLLWLRPIVLLSLGGPSERRTGIWTDEAADAAMTPCAGI